LGTLPVISNEVADITKGHNSVEGEWHQFRGLLTLLSLPQLAPDQFGCFVGRRGGAVQSGLLIAGSEVTLFLRVGDVSIELTDSEFGSRTLSAEIRADVNLARCPIATVARLAANPGAGIKLSEAGVVAKYQFQDSDGELIAAWRNPDEVTAPMQGCRCV
jgi:hypothetical protein